MKYLDLYLLSVPEANLPAYKKVAAKFGKLIKEHGALGYREFLGDDLESDGGVLSFTKAVKPKEGEVIVAAIAEFTNKAHRNQVMKKLLADPRAEELEPNPPLFNMKKMYYGGFNLIVNG